MSKDSIIYNKKIDYNLKGYKSDKSKSKIGLLSNKTGLLGNKKGLLGN